MLQFWKKTNRDKNHLAGTSSLVLNGEDRCDNLQHDKPLQPPSSNAFETLPLSSFDDEGLYDVGDFDSTKERSRLSKTLQEIILDKNALGYFLQYMESRNASPYILCWLDIDTFKSDLNQCQGEVKKCTNLSSVPNSQIDHDSLSVSTDCDSYTADSNSLCDYSTATLSETTNGQCDKDNSDNSVKLRSSNDDVVDRKTVQNTIDCALVIFKKYVAQEAQCNIRCSEEMRKTMMENICNSAKVLSCKCFDPVESYVFEIMENDYLSAFLASDYFCKYQIDVLTSGNVVLEDILYNETALFYFMEYLEQENQRSLLEFWMAASNFHQQLRDQKDFFDPIEAQNDAVVLYDKYFSLQAHCPLGFSNKVRFAVEQNICGENGLIPDCFHLPLNIVEKVLDKNHLRPFLASQLFYKFLSDLINTVQANGYSTSIELNYSPSDCSSEKSFSQSTFLALEVPCNQTKKKDKLCADMTIDTRELYDPDALWKRRKSHRLSLGRVSELGKYETDFEPEPDRKAFKLKDVVKKFVSSEDEHRKKEEMAWQVAEMIVKDITSVTMSVPKS